MKPERAQRLERLVDANPRLEHNEGWLSFDCPIHLSDSDSELETRSEPPPAQPCSMHWCRIAIPLRKGDPHQGWDSNGQPFESLTISPSIARRGGPTGCEWHGFIRNGRFEHCPDSK